MNMPPTNAADDGSRAGSESPLGRAVVTWAQGLGRNEDIVRRVETKVRRARRRRVAAAASSLALLLSAGAVFYSQQANSNPSNPSVRPTSVVTLPLRQTLPDGSVVELKDDARIALHFTGEGNGARRVSLESGEAYFAVAPNPARPFTVAAGGIEVRAVGTAFAVEFGRQEIAVLVTEGQVAVERATSTSAASSVFEPSGVTLGAGQRLLVDLAAATATLPVPKAVTGTELEERLSWRVPSIHFADTPLSEAVAVFNRHSPCKLFIDPALAELRIGGVVRADNTESFLLLLRHEFGIESEAGAGGVIRLQRR